MTMARASSLSTINVMKLELILIDVLVHNDIIIVTVGASYPRRYIRFFAYILLRSTLPTIINLVYLSICGVYWQ
jgi:Na+-translocating ferredoxin:NAD+ oxidoreductase RnfE subunit